MAEFLETIKCTLSENNDARNQAEARYEDAKKNSPTQTVAGLFLIVQDAQVDPIVRGQATILLRQCLGKINEETSIWKKLGDAGQADARLKLLQIFEAEAVKQVRNKVADCVQSVGNQLITIEEGERPQNAAAWPELMPALLRWVCDASKDAEFRASCLWIVKEMVCSVWQILLTQTQHMLQILQACFAEPNEKIRGNAAALFVELIDSIDSKEERKPFAPLIPSYCEALATLANSADAGGMTDALEPLKSCAETADFFKASMASHLVPLLTTIAKSHADEKARKSAFEIIVSFLESKTKAMMKIQGFVEQAFDLCIVYLSTLDDDLTEWLAEDDEHEGEEEGDELFTVGKENIDRICACAQKAEMAGPALEMLKPKIQALLSTGEWKQTVAGISILGQIAEYVDDETTVQQMIGGIRMQLGGSHPRVRYAAWGAIAQFAEDHPETITGEGMPEQILPEFLKAMDDSCERVCHRSMEAFQHYGEAVEREDMEPFVQPLMEKLISKLQAGHAFQKKAITFIAVIAGTIQDGFAAYYPGLMPILKQTVESALHRVEERKLLGKCFECMSLLAKSIGREGFKADAELIMQAMIRATEVPNLPSNDPVKEYMMAASERICGTMKEDFLPFVPHILPGVLEKMTLAPKEFDSNLENNFEEGAEVSLSLERGEDGQVKVLVMYSSEIQDLQAALECVHTFVEELGKAYAPFVQTTAMALLPAFEFSMAEEIRELAFATWGELCSCARSGGNVQVVSELVMEFLKRILPKLQADEVDGLAMKTRADGIQICLSKAGPGILDGEKVRSLCQAMMVLLAESFKRAEAAEVDKQKRRQGGAPDEDDADDDEEVAEHTLQVAFTEVLGAIEEHHPDLFVVEGLPTVLELLARLLQPGAAVDNRKLAHFIVCDMMEHLQERVVSHWPQFLPQLLEDIHNSNAELRQPACYGAALAGRLPAFAPLAQDTAAKLVQVITTTRGRSKKKSEKIAQACADNALTALAAILMNHPTQVAQQEGALWEVWLGGLPCQEDYQEGETNHRTLLRLFQQEQASVVGEAGKNVGKIVGVLADVYDTEMVDEATTDGIGEVLLRLGEAKLQGLAAALTQKQQKKIMRILRQAQQKKS